MIEEQFEKIAHLLDFNYIKSKDPSTYRYTIDYYLCFNKTISSELLEELVKQGKSPTSTAYDMSEALNKVFWAETNRGRDFWRTLYYTIAGAGFEPSSLKIAKIIEIDGDY